MLQHEQGTSTSFLSDEEDADVVEIPSGIKSLAVEGVDVVQVACGDFHSVALTSDGSTWTWGAGILGK
jgi:alpha-tubulin suppressor-like RCC1 family protein